MILQPDSFDDMRDFESRQVYDAVKRSGTLDAIHSFTVYVVSRMTGEIRRKVYASLPDQYEQIIHLAERLAKERVMVASIFMSHRVEIEVERISNDRLAHISSDGVLIYGGTFSIEMMAMGHNAAYFPITREGDRFVPGRLVRLFADPSLVHANGNAVTGFIRTYSGLAEKYNLFPSPEYT